MKYLYTCELIGKKNTNIRFKYSNIDLFALIGDVNDALQSGGENPIDFTKFVDEMKDSLKSHSFYNHFGEKKFYAFFKKDIAPSDVKSEGEEIKKKQTKIRKELERVSKMVEKAKSDIASDNKKSSLSAVKNLEKALTKFESVSEE